MKKIFQTFYKIKTQNKNVQIYDMIGKNVLTTNTDSEVNVSSLTPGLYLARITEEGKTSTKK
jgi:flagellar hook assembly protein FlgD